jgi:hypothetical protein
MGEVTHMEKCNVIASKTCRCVKSNTVITIRVTIANASFIKANFIIIFENLPPTPSIFSLINLERQSLFALKSAMVLEVFLNPHLLNLSQETFIFLTFILFTLSKKKLN